MNATVLKFAPKPIAGRGVPMSQVLPTPRVDVEMRGEWPDHEHVVLFVRHEGVGGTDLLASFKGGDEADAFAEEHYRDLYIGGAA